MALIWNQNFVPAVKSSYHPLVEGRYGTCGGSLVVNFVKFFHSFVLSRFQCCRGGLIS